MARQLLNGAVVSDDGRFCLLGPGKWASFEAGVKGQPGFRETMSCVGHTVGAKVEALNDAGAALMQLVEEQGSLQAAEDFLKAETAASPPSVTGPVEGHAMIWPSVEPSDRDRAEGAGLEPPAGPLPETLQSPAGSQWWDGANWISVRTPTATQATSSPMPTVPVVVPYADLVVPREPVVLRRSLKHQTGLLGFDGTDVVAQLRGFSGGLFQRKTPWQREVRIPLAEATVEQVPGGLTLYRRGAPIETFLECHPDTAVVGFMADVNRGKESTHVPVATEVKPAQVRVTTYKSARDYEKDAQRMIRDGWLPQGQSTGHGKVNMGRTVGKAVFFLPWALMRPSRQGDPITITWVR